MIKVFKFLLIMFLSQFLIVNSVLASGGNRIGTAGAQELLIPVGARGLALNGSYISGLTGVEAIYYNPAGLSGFDGSAQAAFSSMNWIADINFVYAAVGVNTDFGAIGITLRTLDFGDIPVTTEDNSSGTGSTFSPNFVTVGLTYSNFLTDKIKAGFSVNVVTEQIVNTSASGVSFDAGIQYSGLAEVEGLKLGIVLRNFGSNMTFDGSDLNRTATESGSFRGAQNYQIDAEAFELPSQLELGLSYDLNLQEQFGAVLSSTFQNNNFANDEFKLGVELNYDELLFLRGGYAVANSRGSVDDADDNIFGPSFGAGFQIKGDLNIMIDYAYRTVDFFDSNQVFGLMITF